ncbi:MAG: hypothetical protein LBE36_10765 [Flavobacteriaceae bacterium]|jgi:hypothetical protein|nr:hypothetical protein [Flavobacteriaceae bacterium]
MKNLKLPFKIGLHYENWEFSLEVSDVEKIKGFDTYFYLQKIKFLNTIPKRVELTFSWDILEVVTFTLGSEQLHQLKNALNQHFKEKIKNIEIYQLENNLELLLVYISDKIIEVSYGNKEYLREIYK